MGLLKMLFGDYSSKEIKRITREYYEQLHTNKLDNLKR